MGLFDKVKQGVGQARQGIQDIAEGIQSAPSQTTGTVCPSCGTVQQTANAKFCERCGAAIPESPEFDRKEQRQLEKKQQLLAQLDAEIAAKQAQIVTFDDAILMQEYGLYEPRYDFANSTQYKDRLKQVRDWQKQMIRDDTACTGNKNWMVNNSKSQGRKMVKDVQKLLLRSFNNESDEVIGKVKHSNFEASRDRIYKSADAVSKLGKTWDICITQQYISAKVDELHLAFEFAMAKEREKEELRELREREREEAKLQKEIEAQRKKLEKERKQYEQALADLERQIAGCDESERQALEEKKAEIVDNIGEVDKGIQDVDYREANQRAGYVYVISNIGSFGEDVYKIGMTRRLDPMERIYELGDASVPFNFDVHAMIFTDDAPGLEAALHNYFASRKLNLVNQRREFFNCTLDEIMQAVKENFDKTVEFQEVPDAEQYRTSKAMREAGVIV